MLHPVLPLSCILSRFYNPPAGNYTTQACLKAILQVFSILSTATEAVLSSGELVVGLALGWRPAGQSLSQTLIVALTARMSGSQSCLSDRVLPPR